MVPNLICVVAALFVDAFRLVRVRLAPAVLAFLALATPAQAARLCDGIDDSIIWTHQSVFNGRGTLAISFWYKPLASTGNDFYARILSQENGAASTGWHVSMGEFNESNLTIGFRDNSVHESALDSGSPFVRDVWQHVYITYDGSEDFANEFFDNRIKTWLNGFQTNPPGFYGANDIPATMGAVSDPLRLCHSGGYGATYWHGEIAEIGIWLDDDETRVAGLASGKAPDCYPSNRWNYLPLKVGDGAVDLDGHAGSPTINGTTEVEHPGGITNCSTGGGGGGGGLAFVNSAQGDDFGGGEALTIATNSFSVTSGNLLVCGVSHGTSAAATAAVTDTAGNTYTEINTAAYAGSDRLRMFYAKNIAGSGTNIVTATMSVSVAFRSIICAQFSGLNTWTPLDASATGHEDIGGMVMSNTGRAFTTSQANEVIVAIGRSDVTGAIFAADTGYTYITDATSVMALAYRVVSAIQTSATVTLGFSGGPSPWEFVLATFK